MPIIEELPLSFQRPTGPGWTYVVEAHRNGGPQSRAHGDISGMLTHGLNSGGAGSSTGGTPALHSPFPIDTTAAASSSSQAHFAHAQTAGTGAGSGAGVAHLQTVHASSPAGANGGQNIRVRALKRQRAGINSILLEEQQSSKAMLAATRRLAELERENGRDVQIPIPVVKSDRKKHRYNSATTSAVRKILQSQKNFLNHLNDEEAMISLQRNQSLYATNTSSYTPPTKPIVDQHSLAIERKQNDQNATLESGKKPKPRFPLSVDTPNIPSRELLTQLTSPSVTPALSYMASRARPEDVSIALASQVGLGFSGPTRARMFCEYCGYWGKVKCLQCGSHTCSLVCKRLHDELCLRRYA